MYGETVDSPNRLALGGRGQFRGLYENGRSVKVAELGYRTFRRFDMVPATFYGRPLAASRARIEGAARWVIDIVGGMRLRVC